MTDHPMLQKAMWIAAEAHEGQSSKTGAPFIDHVRRVASMVQGAEQTLVAWLHDVVEKSDNWTLERLRLEGFPHEVVDAVDAMTKREGEDYFDFVRRSIADPLARPVKRADLTDNLLQMRRMNGNESKFAQALNILDAVYPLPREP